MQKLLTALVISVSLLAASCGSGSANKDGSLEAKKKELADLRSQQDKLATQVTDLEKEIAKLDPSMAKEEKPKLVGVTAVSPVAFTHYIDLQGKVDADDISYAAPRGNPGVAREIYVKKGDAVKKGQVLLKMDDAIARQQLNNAQTQLSYAKDIYQRRKNLWDQKIGTEVDLVTAKNNVDMAENQIKILQEQLSFSNVIADISGVVDDITVKVGEIFQGGTQLRLVNTSSLKAVVQVPEVYQESVKVGTPVKVVLPELNNKVINGTVHVTGKLIDPGSRSFYVEVRMPSDKDLRPNQIAILKLQDYRTGNALTIPINTLQTDEKGKFVMVATLDSGKLRAHKRSVTIGQTYNDSIEIKSGLQQGDQLVTEGFQGLYEGQLLTTEAK